MKRWLLALAGAGFLLAAGVRTAVPLAAQAQGEAAQAAQAQFYEEKVKPVLVANCIGCHSNSAMGGLRLDSRDALLKGGSSGPAVVAGDPDKSLLMAAVRHTGGVKMPMGGEKLSDAQIGDLAAWIRNGAVFPRAAGAKPEAVLSDHFETHIRPVLAQQCFACHTNSKSGGLRLDTRADMLTGGKSGPAVVPGDPDRSLLLSAIKHAGIVRMPKGATRLPDDTIANFTTWIADGAFWPADKTLVKNYTEAEKNLWSIKPLASQAPPAVKDAAWPANDVDRFVLARLEQQGLRPAPVADRRTLLRRVTYDLTGLLPSHEQVLAFEKDTAPDAWEKVIDRLLASPQYGEKWARHWMDVVRYGEDDYRVGKQPDRAEKYPFAYLYRDWLIKALNDDMPYDMFVKAQLAADLLPESIRDRHLPALGMNGNGIWIFHASPAPVERADEWHDKVDVTSKAFLGLTVGCARCHDHKYDAIYAKDYYQMASIFASSRFKSYPRVPKSVADAYEKEKKTLEKKNREVRKFLENASSLYAQMLLMQTENYMMAAWKLGKDKKTTLDGVADEAKLDPELLARWVTFLKKKPDNYSALKPWQELVAAGSGKEEDARTLAKAFYAKLLDVNDKQKKLEKENEFTLSQVKGGPVLDEDEDDPKEPYDPLPNGLKRFLNRYQVDLKSLEREDNMLWRDVFERDVPEATADVDEDPRNRKPGLFKLTDGALERRLTADLKAHLERARAEIEAFKKAMGPEPPAVYGIEEAKEPSDLKVFVRGNPYAFGDDAPRAFPSIFTQGKSKPYTNGSGRLEFAEEIGRQPLAARVIVNRLWRWHMGRGIVDTPSNFGMVGEKPSNPELLEYLAAGFIADGMSWKAMHKRILMSKTYQLSARPVPGNAKDPDNRFFWRANRERVEAEGVWDMLLQTSGAIDLKGVGGPSEDMTEKMTRRAVYGKVSRMYPGDFQTTFDLPPATISAEKRYVTNVPQQRLFFLNSTFVQTQAERIAGQLLELESPAARVRKAFETIYQREPSPDELAAAVELIQLPAEAPPAAARDGQKDGGADDKDAPKKLPDSPLRSFIWALLSSNEFLYID
jgi:mono/diheme cytochrome c family protein